jgi:P4 family phage/plasmid primase-like protien
MAGYWVTGSVVEHAFFFVYGGGGNGKSTFVETIAGIMGDYATTIGSEMLMVSHNDRHPTEVAQLRGKRLAVASEIEQGKSWAEAKIKALTGGDTVQARFMRQDFFTFNPTFKLVVYGNHKPSLRNVDAAIQRRMHLVPFTAIIPPAKQDKHFRAKLEPEWPAILRWIIDGCLLWQEFGLKPPEIVRAATTSYLEAEDSFELWRAECTKPDRNAWEAGATLYASWKSWAERAGELAGNQRAFSNKLLDHGFVAKNSGKANVRGYLGAKLITLNSTMEDRGLA